MLILYLKKVFLINGFVGKVVALPVDIKLKIFFVNRFYTEFS